MDEQIPLARRSPVTANSSRYDQFPKHFPFAFLKSLCLVLEGSGAASEAFLWAWGLDRLFTQLLQINSKHW